MRLISLILVVLAAAPMTIVPPAFAGEKKMANNESNIDLEFAKSRFNSSFLLFDLSMDSRIISWKYALSNILSSNKNREGTDL